MTVKLSPLRRAALGVFAILFLGLSLAASPPAGAATPSGSGAPAVQVPLQTGAAFQTVNVEDLQKLVGTLEDDKQRQQFVAQLRALIEAQKKMAGAASATSAPPPTLAQPSTIVNFLGDRLQTAGEDIVNSAALLVNAPSVVEWFKAQVQDPDLLSQWEEVGISVGTILLSAFVAEFIVRRLVFLLFRGGARRLPKRRSGKIMLLIMPLVLGLLPILAFQGIASIVTGMVQPREMTALVATLLIHAFVYSRIIITVAYTLLLAPFEGGWSLFRLTEETATYLFTWLRRFVNITIWGYSLITAIFLLGAPLAVLSTLKKLVALLLTVLGIIFILQNRKPFGDWLRPRRHEVDPEAAADASAMDGESAIAHPSRPLNIVRERLADVWHVLAILYLGAIFIVYALDIENGFNFVLRGTLFSLGVLIAARFLAAGLRQLAERGFAIPKDMKHRFPTLERRANKYLPVLYTLGSLAVWVFAVLCLLQSWEIDSFSWLSSEIGRRFAGSTMTIAFILVLAFIAWELFNAAIDRYLSGVSFHGQHVSRSARARTLLPLFRNAAWITLLLVVALLILSELGINIAPLLAGAGVVGLAIGFGSQALVKDIITGMFMLIEDTISVGDVVDFGGGHSGVIEAISIRTIRLRDKVGAVHTIPFSAVAQVVNQTKDYAYHFVDVTVTYTSDIEKVTGVFKEIHAELKADPLNGPFIIGDMEILGMSSFSPSGITIQGRMKTMPTKQWALGREYSRRLKAAFDREGIILPGREPSGPTTIKLDDETVGALSNLRVDLKSRPAGMSGPAEISGTDQTKPEAGPLPAGI